MNNAALKLNDEFVSDQFGFLSRNDRLLDLSDRTIKKPVGSDLRRALGPIAQIRQSKMRRVIKP